MRNRIATILSAVGHPFVLVPLTVAVTARTAWLGVGIAAVTVLAMLAVIAIRVRSGRWSDHDVSDAEQRHEFYPMALAVVGAGAVAMWALGAPAGVVRGFGVAVCLLVAAAAITRWTKVSLHTMFGAFCAAAVVTAGVAMTVGFLALAAGVAWSRVALGRHTIGQVALGGIVGGLGGVALILINALT